MSAPQHFASAPEFRLWLETHHAAADELTVLLHRKGTARGGMTYAEALDEALCYGWIDGVRRGHGPDSYTIRFTPRKPGSIWSKVNIRHAERLIAARRMRPAGAAAFERRTTAKSGVYSFENKPEKFLPDLEREFQRNAKAWAFFHDQPPGYRRTITWWVVSAKQEATRQRRLAQVISESTAQRRVDMVSPFRSGGRKV